MIPQGISFAPGQQIGAYGGGMQRPVNPVQDAIKTLSFRIPSNVGASAIGPQAILGQNPLSAGPTSQTASVQNWLRSLFGGMPQPGGMAPMPQPYTQAAIPQPQGAPPQMQGGQPPLMNPSQFMPSFVFQGSNQGQGQAAMPQAAPGLDRGGFGGGRSV